MLIFLMPLIQLHFIGGNQNFRRTSNVYDEASSGWKNRNIFVEKSHDEKVGTTKRQFPTYV